MILLSFIFSHDDIFRGVKQETSLLAIRQRDEEGYTLFEELVFDEAYEIKFRELFYDAQVRVTETVSAYLKGLPVQREYFETQDFSKNRDYSFSLEMPDDFVPAMYRPVDVRITEFLVAFIVYRWLETKLPSHAALFLARAQETLSKAQVLLDRRIHPVRLKGRWI